MISEAASSGLNGTFRDPAGSLVRSDSRIFRVVNRSGFPDLEAFLSTDIAKELTETGHLANTTRRTANELPQSLHSLVDSHRDGAYAVYEHTPVWFPSYAYEWSAEMLYSAAVLTLDIAESALDAGFGLKDATPFNILFESGKPVFVDLCSFERRVPGDPIWLASAQFERMFLLPLLVSRKFGIDPDSVFQTNLDGLDVGKVRKWFRFPEILSPIVFKLAVLPNLLNRIAQSNYFSTRFRYGRRVDAAMATAILKSAIHALRAKLAAVKPLRRDSVWSDYDPEAAEVHAKVKLVTSVISEHRPATVLDIGCNNGIYSRIAARGGAKVLALDSDATVVGRFWREISNEQLDILPLVANFARPTPGYGWGNREHISFEGRTQSRFDAVLMLAVIHHIVVRDRIPLAQIFETLAGFTTGILIIEFVANNDSMFKRISVGREYLFTGHTEENFVAASAPYFHTMQRLPQESGTRVLFVMQKRT